MSEDAKIFGIIVEWKNQAPLIMEGEPMDYEQASSRMKHFVNDPKVVRVAIFRAIFADGNKTILPIPDGEFLEVLP